MSPLFTVLVLVVLWLIVVVPMIVRRNDDRARERSVQGFGVAMRALTRRHVALERPVLTPPHASEARRLVNTRVSLPQGDLFVPGARTDFAPSVRRPVPVAEEALMYPVDRSDMSAARAQMLARRRRSLAVLGGGSLVSVILAIAIGGPVWVLALLFVCGLGGYVYFLRSQAVRDRERRQARQVRAATREAHGFDATELPEELIAGHESAVEIDDDDIELHNLDTVDLTGLYDEDVAPRPAQRRAS